MAVVSATAGTLLTNVTALNGTFASTGLGTLFSASIFGIILVAAIWSQKHKVCDVESSPCGKALVEYTSDNTRPFY